MSKNRLFSIMVVAVLILVTVLTFQQSFETSKVVLASGITDHFQVSPSGVVCDYPLVSRTSIQRVYVPQMNTSVTYTASGPTGVDGGLIHLLSDYRLCSK
jgi:hypothetical protein